MRHCPTHPTHVEEKRFLRWIGFAPRVFLYPNLDRFETLAPGENASIHTTYQPPIQRPGKCTFAIVKKDLCPLWSNTVVHHTHKAGGKGVFLHARDRGTPAAETTTAAVHKCACLDEPALVQPSAPLPSCMHSMFPLGREVARTGTSKTNAHIACIDPRCTLARSKGLRG